MALKSSPKGTRLLLQSLVILCLLSHIWACTNSWTLYKNRSSSNNPRYRRQQLGEYTEESCKLKCAKRYNCNRVEYMQSNKTCWTSESSPSQVETPGINTWELYKANCPSCYTSFTTQYNTTTKNGVNGSLTKVEMSYASQYYCQRACGQMFGCQTAEFVNNECWLGSDANAETETKLNATRYVTTKADSCGDGCAVFTWLIYQKSKSTGTERKAYEEGERINQYMCMRACEATANCVAIEYDRDGDRCSFFYRSQAASLTESYYVNYYELTRHGCNEWTSNGLKLIANDPNAVVDKTGQTVVGINPVSTQQQPCQVLTSPQTSTSDNYMLSIFLGINAKPEIK